MTTLCADCHVERTEARRSIMDSISDDETLDSVRQFLVSIGKARAIE